MATIRRYRVLWSGITGLPGYSLFYASSAAALGSDLLTFFTAIKGLFPNNLSWDIPISGDTLDDGTGAVNGGWTDLGGGVVTSTLVTAYAAGVGAYASWHTNAIVGRRRLQGRTFLAPLGNLQYDTGGSIVPSAQAVLTPAISALAAAGKMVTWHRPTGSPLAGGSSSLVISGTLPDQVTSLRSRRR